MKNLKPQKMKLSIKSFEFLRDLIDTPPPPNPALAKAMANYKARSHHDPVTGVTTINLDTEEATMQK